MEICLKTAERRANHCQPCKPFACNPSTLYCPYPRLTVHEAPTPNMLNPTSLQHPARGNKTRRISRTWDISRPRLAKREHLITDIVKLQRTTTLKLSIPAHPSNFLLNPETRNLVQNPHNTFKASPCKTRTGSFVDPHTTS